VRDDFKKKHGRRLLFSHKRKSNNSVPLSLSLCAKKKQRDARAQTAVSKLERSNKRRRSRCESGSRTINPQTKTTTPPATYRGREQTNKPPTHPTPTKPRTPPHHDATNQTQPSATTQMGQNQTKHSKSQNTNGGGRKKAHVCIGSSSSSSSSAAEKRRREKCIR
jgi:hypothetical protein